MGEAERRRSFEAWGTEELKLLITLAERLINRWGQGAYETIHTEDGAPVFVIALDLMQISISIDKVDGLYTCMNQTADRIWEGHQLTELLRKLDVPH